MLNILFVCHGNICRSPMAEMILKHLVAKENLQDHFYIDSAGTSDEEAIYHSLYTKELKPFLIRTISHSPNTLPDK